MSEPQERKREMPVLLSRAQLGLITFAEKSTAGYRDQNAGARECLHVTPEQAEATNGIIALSLKHEKADASEFPEVPGAPDGPPQLNALLPAPAVQSALKALPKTPLIAVQKYARLSGTHGGKGETCLVTANGSAAAVQPIPENDARFPKLEKVLPGTEGHLCVTLNAKVIKALAEYAIKYSGHRTPPISLFFRIPSEETGIKQVGPDGAIEGSGDTIRIEVPFDGGGKAIGALMPMRR